MWYGAIRVGTVEYGIIGKVEQDGLHLAPNHTLYQIARLRNCSSGSGKMDSTQVEPFANIVHGPLMTWGISVRKMKDIVMIVRFLNDCHRRLGNVIHRDDVGGGMGVCRQIYTEIQSV